MVSMKKYMTSLGALALAAGLSSMTQAADFSLSGCDAGGCGSANMSIIISGNNLTLTLDNTSDTALQDGTPNANAPGITGFGFNTKDPDPTVTSWSLTAKDKDTNNVVIGNSAGTSTGDWKLNTSIAGVSLDFLPTTDGNNIKGALYNPSATGPFGALPNYFTTATLLMSFDSAPELDTEACGGGIFDCQVFVRMQNVGKNGEGSLKLVPIPAAAWLFGSALVGLAGISRRKKAS